MSIETINLEVNQGDDHEFNFELSSVDNDEPMDLTNCKFVFGARYKLNSEKADIKVECTTDEVSTVKLILAKELTSKLLAINEDSAYNKMYYDIQMLQKNVSHRIVQGKLFISAGNAFREGNK